MTPVAKTGLHCGTADEGQTLAKLAEVTPVAKTGLHCGPAPLDGILAHAAR